MNFKSFLELKGEKIYLKKLGIEYKDEYWKSFNEEGDIESVIFTGTQQMFCKENVERYLEDISTDNSRVDFLMFSRASDELIGEVVINDIYRNNRSASIRIGIFKKENFSKGYGSEALILALNYGFGMLNLHRIELEALEFNERAIHVYEKVGFRREGIKRDGWYFNHRYYDLVTLSMLEEDFRKKYVNEKVDFKELL
ncbi:GNAT family protein [Clostridium sp. C8-1-8]|uniref:GNAT family N-acetyltransferase n=1 Tax=Clostridium sp. C8-1-8 TaxID=2698831 RepID=UPI001367FB72|nr:GNAT family protein [Clostridium sp. C8-1-8]